MRLSRLVTALAGAGFIAGVSAAHGAPTISVENGTPAERCTGTACASVLFEVSGGCFNATNLSGKPIVIEWGGYELKVGAGQSKAVKKDGRCVRDVGGPLIAAFV